ncbi:hypothetical protein [Bradyrhizobium iriomotense]|uniref:hypothetical protein n=1 Tax=Bradyrhizobium iriomotense TaxID=441950 RepID=UPI0024E16D73|nr:hypothetical protein [Bradyrhizobium iriomotense]
MRERLAMRIKELQPKASNRQVAKVLGVGSRTVDRDTASNDAPAERNLNPINAPQTAAAPNDAKPISGPAAARLIERRETGAAERKERVRAFIASHACGG